MIIPPGLVLMTNIIVYSGNETMSTYLFGFLLMSLILMVRSNIDMREWQWYLQSQAHPATVPHSPAAGWLVAGADNPALRPS